ncbi:MAG: hypothetical protein H3C64_03385 [Candidatus Kuenenia stuttgartiensis]|nr:hypothetical protein [Candidatus Kuenenia stuttgartiensis]
MKQTDTLTEEKFNAAYQIIAAIVTKYGDKYLPIFKRMHEEKQLRQANAELEMIAKTVASQSDNT